MQRPGRSEHRGFTDDRSDRSSTTRRVARSRHAAGGEAARRLVVGALPLPSAPRCHCRSRTYSSGTASGPTCAGGTCIRRGQPATRPGTCAFTTRRTMCSSPAITYYPGSVRTSPPSAVGWPPSRRFSRPPSTTYAGAGRSRQPAGHGSRQVRAGGCVDPSRSPAANCAHRSPRSAVRARSG